MAMLVWAMMGIALWHFTIFIPTASGAASSARSSARCSAPS